MPAHLPPEAAELVRAVVGLAEARDDVRAVALVGSHARSSARAGSDVDLVLLSTQPGLYGDTAGWLPALPGARLIDVRPWGVLTEYRLALEGGQEVDFGVAPVEWAAVPLDAGTRRVAADGLVSLHDPDGLLAAVAAAVRPAP